MWRGCEGCWWAWCWHARQITDLLQRSSDILILVSCAERQAPWQLTPGHPGVLQCPWFCKSLRHYGSTDIPRQQLCGKCPWPELQSRRLWFASHQRQVHEGSWLAWKLWGSVAHWSVQGCDIGYYYLALIIIISLWTVAPDRFSFISGLLGLTLLSFFFFAINRIWVYYNSFSESLENIIHVYPLNLLIDWMVSMFLLC